MKGRILVIDDNPTMREGIFEVVTRMGYEIISSSSGAEGLRLLRDSPFDFVIVDLKMSGMDGIEVLKKIKESDRDTVVMMMTAYGNIETAVEAMKLGAFDFITKPFTPDLLRLKVTKAIEIAEANKERKRLSVERICEKEERKADKITGHSPATKKILAKVKKMAASESAVLIFGESGTGKELFAREMHDISRRKDRPFAKIDCASTPEGDFEAVLFGSGGNASENPLCKKTGLADIADGGTLLLDEISMLPAKIQNKVLRLLESKEFERPGTGEILKTDLRIIASTSRDLAKAVDDQEFRKDLYYKLSVLTINMPPLSERIEDIAWLSKHFLSRLCKRTGKRVKRLSKKALSVLKSYDWPGNISELKGVIEQACVLSESDVITPKDLTLTLLKPAPTGKVPPYTGIPLSKYLDDIEKNLIETTLKENKGIKTRTAKKLGIKTSLLYYKLEKYGLDKAGSDK